MYFYKKYFYKDIKNYPFPSISLLISSDSLVVLNTKTVKFIPIN